MDNSRPRPAEKERQRFEEIQNEMDAKLKALREIEDLSFIQQHVASLVIAKNSTQREMVNYLIPTLQKALNSTNDPDDHLLFMSIQEKYGHVAAM